MSKKTDCQEILQMQNEFNDPCTQQSCAPKKIPCMLLLNIKIIWSFFCIRTNMVQSQMLHEGHFKNMGGQWLKAFTDKARHQVIYFSILHLHYVHSTLYHIHLYSLHYLVPLPIRSLTNYLHLVHSPWTTNFNFCNKKLITLKAMQCFQYIPIHMPRETGWVFTVLAFASLWFQVPGQALSDPIN